MVQLKKYKKSFSPLPWTW